MNYPRIAHSAIICGATGCGKTEFVLDLLENEYLKKFTYIIVICPTLKYNEAYLNRDWLFKDTDQVFLVVPDEWYSNYDDSFDKSLRVFYEIFGKKDDGHALFLIDDCSAQKGMTKKKQTLSDLAFSGRHANCSLWILTQKYNSVLTDVREQIKWMALFHCKDRDSFDEALKENDVIDEIEERKKVRKTLAKNKHSKLIIINEQPTSFKLFCELT